MTEIEFDNLIPVVTYDEWIIAKNKDEKYYVKDSKAKDIFEVELVYKEKNNINDGKDVVDFGGDYDGESDDMEWLMSFNIKE